MTSARVNDAEDDKNNEEIDGDNAVIDSEDFIQCCSGSKCASRSLITNGSRYRAAIVTKTYIFYTILVKISGSQVSYQI